MCDFILHEKFNERTIWKEKKTKNTFKQKYNISIPDNV